MSDATGAVFVDLDRTLIRSASGPVFQEAMVAAGVLAAGRKLPGDRYLYGFYNSFGETVPFMGLARAAARMMKGRPAAGVRTAGAAVVEDLIDLVQPWALEAVSYTHLLLSSLSQCEGTTSPPPVVPLPRPGAVLPGGRYRRSFRRLPVTRRSVVRSVPAPVGRCPAVG